MIVVGNVKQTLRNKAKQLEFQFIYMEEGTHV
jgi:hypothetical protein